MWGDKDSALDIRYGRHNDYQRVVIEGPHDFITTAQVKQKDKQVRVTFASQDFSLNDTKLPITYRRDKNVLVFEQDNTASIKLRNLSDPSRLVIDLYPGTSTSDQKKDSKTKPGYADGKHEVAGAAPAKAEKKISQAQPDKKEEQNRAMSEVKKESVKNKKNKKTGDTDPTIDIRYGRHNDYQRVVIEGPHDYITTAQVNQKDKQVMVTFASQDFSLNDIQLPITYRRDKNVLIFHQDKTDTIRHRNLSGPTRLVIDFYTGNELSGHKMDTKADVAADKTEVAATEPTIIEKKEQEQRTQSEAGESVINKKTEKNPVNPLHAEEAQASDKQEITKEKKNSDTDFVPEQYKKLWTLLETGNNYGLLTALPEYKPENAGSVAVYHYMYGAASFGAKQYQNAIAHLRLAYIYSTNQRLKEKALSLRAKTYMTIKLYQEARADYMMLIETFPSSKKIRKSYLGLGDSLVKLGLYRKAVKAYDKAGEDAVILYHKANALQYLEKVTEAKEYYEKAKLADNTYPAKSHETYYLLGENMRMSGDLKQAAQHMSKIISGPYRDSANISLGLISLKEGNTTEAVNKFIVATNANDRKIKISALFNLALAKIKTGKLKEATAYLETIRYEYVDSYIYKDTLLALAKIYRKEKQTKRSLSLLKELVYGKQPPQDAFNELENIILDSLDQTDRDEADRMHVADIWKEVGQWLVHEKREEFLVTVSESLRNYRMPFIELSEWLIQNASQGSRGRVALNLADYYAGIGEISMAKMYITMAMNKQLPADDVLRVEVKILSASGKRKMALDKLVEIEHIGKEDVVMLGNIMFDIRNPNSITVQKGIEFYKKVLAESDWDADAYIRLADILDASGRGSEAAEYYRIAHKKNPEDEWAIYRIGRWSDRDESEKMFSILQNGDSLISRFAKTELTRINIVNKVNEVY